jgi:hypothetical protein
MKPEQIKDLSLPPYEKTLDPAGIDKMTDLMVKHKMIDSRPDSKAILYRTVTTPPK